MRLGPSLSSWWVLSRLRSAWRTGTEPHCEVARSPVKTLRQVRLLCRTDGAAVAAHDCRGGDRISTQALVAVQIDRHREARFGSKASDRRARRLRGMSAVPPIATE